MPLTKPLDVEDLPVDVFALADDGLEPTSLTAGELAFRNVTGRSCVCWTMDGENT